MDIRRAFQKGSASVANAATDLELVMVNDVVISEMRKADGYVNATRMCQAAGKLWGNYFQNQRTQHFLEAASTTIGKPIVELVVQQHSGNGGRHTWVHPQIAINLAAWCSAEFDAAVSSLVFRYMTGQVTTEESRAVAASLGFIAPPLPPPDVRVSSLVSSLEKLGIAIDNPRWNQGLRDMTMNILGMRETQQALPGGPVERWAGVVELAEDMGFREATKPDVRTRLGRHISNTHDWNLDNSDLQRKREKRLCNGTDREIWVYRDTPAIRQLIAEFFSEE